MANELEELKKMKTDLDGFIHLAETSAEREQLEKLRVEVSSDRKRAEELHAKAYQVAISNQSKIKTLKAEAEKLRLESVDISVDAWELETRLRAKQTDMYRLEKAIKEKQIVE
jgi:DNA repair exonuclease SbcCD ATPase subunit